MTVGTVPGTTIHVTILARHRLVRFETSVSLTYDTFQVASVVFSVMIVFQAHLAEIAGAKETYDGS